MQYNVWHKRLEFPGGETIVMHNANVIVHFTASSQPDEWGSTQVMHQAFVFTTYGGTCSCHGMGYSIFKYLLTSSYIKFENEECCMQVFFFEGVIRQLVQKVLTDHIFTQTSLSRTR